MQHVMLKLHGHQFEPCMELMENNSLEGALKFAVQVSVALRVQLVDLAEKIKHRREPTTVNVVKHCVKDSLLKKCRPCKPKILIWA